MGRAATLYSGKIQKMSQEAIKKYGSTNLHLKNKEELDKEAQPRARKESTDFFKEFDGEKTNAALKAKKEEESSSIVIERVNTPKQMTPTVSQDSNGMPDISKALDAWTDDKPEKVEKSSTNAVRGLNLANIKAVESLSINSGEPSEQETDSAMEKSTTSVSSDVKLVSLKSSSNRSSLSNKKGGVKKGGLGAKKNSRFGGAKVKVDMKKLESEAQKVVETGVAQKVTADPVVTNEKRQSFSAKGSGNVAQQKRQNNMDRLGMGGRGIRTVQHGSQMKTIEQVRLRKTF